MRKILSMCYLCLILSFILPLFLERGEDPPAVPEETPFENKPLPSPAAPAGEMIKLLAGGEILEIPMEEYLLGVLAAEMPASFPEEALRAQSVAARSYTLYCASLNKHGTAQVCADPGCCQAWADSSDLVRRWGDKAAYYRARMEKALQATAGEYLAYDGKAICAAFHSSSAGTTEYSASIWNPTPYLVSVDSPETAERVPELVSYAWLSPGDFAAGLCSLHPEFAPSSDPEDWIEAVQYSEGGRVNSVRICALDFTGAELRGLFALRSTDFQLVYDGSGFAFTVFGYGHGVGMSQYGAKLMAEDGADYREILSHYYPGTSLMA